MFKISLAVASLLLASGAVAQQTTAANQTTGQIVDQLPAQRNLQFSLESWITAQAKGLLTDQGDELNADNYVGLSYRFSNGIKTGLRQYIMLDLDQGEDNHSFDDTMIFAKQKFKLNRGLGLSLAGRYYAPTGEDSRDYDLLGKARILASVTQQINAPISLSYYFWPYKYFSKNGVNPGSTRPNKDYRLVHFVSARYKFNRKLALRQSIGQDLTWFHGDSTRSIGVSRAEFLSLYTMLDYEINNYVKMSVGINQDHATDKPVRQFSPYRQSESTYHFITTAQY